MVEIQAQSYTHDLFSRYYSHFMIDSKLSELNIT